MKTTKTVLTIAVTEDARQEILAWAQRRRLLPAAIWMGWLEHRGFESGATALRALALRHGLPTDALADEWNARLEALPEVEEVAWEGSRVALLLLPDEEFLAALVHAHDAVEGLLAKADEVLARHGTPWRLSPAGRIVWTGDRAVDALLDPVLAAAAGHFEAARQLRVPGTLESCDAAIEHASRAVEETLLVLIRAHVVAPPRHRGLLSLFDALAWGGVLPAYLEPVITAPGAARCQLLAPVSASGRARVVPAELADAAIGSAATAITLLARYLP